MGQAQVGFCVVGGEVPEGCVVVQVRGELWLAAERVGNTLGLRPAGLVAVASPGARWTCLQLDWHDILLIHLNQRCSHLKSVRLCASLLVQSLYPSDQCFSPGEGCAPRTVLSLLQLTAPGSQPWRVPALALNSNAHAVPSLSPQLLRCPWWVVVSGSVSRQ